MGDGNGPARVRTEPCAKRVRAFVGGQLVADSRRPVLVWENPWYPAYYVPADDVVARTTPVGPAAATERGAATVHDVEVAGRVLAGVATVHDDPSVPQLHGLVRLEWGAMDEWLEEDEPVYTHPRDPHHRVDVLASSRHVQVRVGDVLVADSRQPRILFETGLPPRYYLPMSDVRMDLLRPVDTVTHCPYKGAATYWDVVVDGTAHQGLAWGYRVPLPESQKIAGLVCFYNEKVDLTVDGVAEGRPVTPFS